MPGFRPDLSSLPEYCDASTVRALIAILRIGLSTGGAVGVPFYDDVGRLLQPALIALRASAAPDSSTWAEQYDQAAEGSEFEALVWIGKNLSMMPKQLEPMYQGILAMLSDACGRMQSEVGPNLEHLGRIFGLDEVECRLLELAAALELSRFGLTYLDIDKPILRVQRAIATAVGMPVAAVQKALERNGRLWKTGLLEAQETGTRGVDEILALSVFGRRVFSMPYATLDQLLCALLERLPAAANATPLSWPSLQSEQNMVSAILQSALERRTKGINILLYGTPGTGKTEFARHLAGVLHCVVYQVPYKDEDGNEASRTERLCGLHFADHILGALNAALIVLDEAEDIFHETQWSSRGKPTAAVGGKAWMNNLLETNASPVIWISNQIQNMDPAYLRRFTYCVRFDMPHAAVRRQIAERYLAPVGVSASVISAVAQRREFSPALASACARVVQLASGKAGTEDEVALSHLQSHSRLMQLPPSVGAQTTPTRYDERYLHIAGKFSATQIVAAITRNGSGTVLMSGPPGTGKTQLATHMANRLERELLCYTASDINAKWFGESERNVAALFAACDTERQMIFLDEAETLLGAREQAMHRGIEAVTAEFLRQLEHFSGVFLCATNHADSFDSALVRRFTFRLQFRPLSLGQREMMLRELAAWPEDQPLPSTCLRHLGQLEGLTPGDFANVAKRFKLLGHAATIDDWLFELADEWKAKPGNAAGRPVGFV